MQLATARAVSWAQLSAFVSYDELQATAARGPGPSVENPGRHRRPRRQMTRNGGRAPAMPSAAHRRGARLTASPFPWPPDAYRHPAFGESVVGMCTANDSA